jgi:hypothetical protein
MPQRRFPPALSRYCYELIHDLKDLEYRKFMRDLEHYPGNWHCPEGKPKERRRADREEREEREERRWAFNPLQFFR